MPAVIGLNGPPKSGKGWLALRLKEMIPDAVIMNIQDGIYQSMQDAGIASREMSYAEFKETEPDARRKIIEHAESARKEDKDVFTRIITDNDTYRTARVVIFDNVGFNHEVAWFQAHSSMFILLRIDVPIDVREPFRHYSRRSPDVHWHNDSRYPIAIRSGLVAYDSYQMHMLLRWITSGSLSSEQAGPYNEFRTEWFRWFAERESTGDLFATGSDAG